MPGLLRPVAVRDGAINFGGVLYASTRNSPANVLTSVEETNCHLRKRVPDKTNGLAYLAQGSMKGLLESTNVTLFSEN